MNTPRPFAGEASDHTRAPLPSIKGEVGTRGEDGPRTLHPTRHPFTTPETLPPLRRPSPGCTRRRDSQSSWTGGPRGGPRRPPGPGPAVSIGVHTDTATEGVLLTRQNNVSDGSPIHRCPHPLRTPSVPTSPPPVRALHSPPTVPSIPIRLSLHPSTSLSPSLPSHPSSSPQRPVGETDGLGTDQGVP